MIAALGEVRSTLEVGSSTRTRLSLIAIGTHDPLSLTVAAYKTLLSADHILIDPCLKLDEEFFTALDIGDLPRSPIGTASDFSDMEELVTSVAHTVCLIFSDPNCQPLFTQIADHFAKRCHVHMLIGSDPHLMAISTSGYRIDRPVHINAGCDDQSPTCIHYTTASQLDKISHLLGKKGYKRRDKVRLVFDYATIQQRSIVTTISRMDKSVPVGAESSPVMVVFGDNVEQITGYDWYESQPLLGWQILIPQTKGERTAIDSLLDLQGAQTIPLPTLAIEDPRTTQPLEKAIQGLVDGRYQWIIFNSANCVHAVTTRLASFGLDARAFSGVRVAAVGIETIEALKAWGIQPDLIPWGEQRSESLANEFPAYDDLLDPINRVFLTRAEVAVDSLAEALCDLGWEVDAVMTHRTVRAAPPDSFVRESIKAGAYDAVIFTSVTSVRNMIGIAGKPHPAMVIAAIGPATAQACREYGLEVHVTSGEPDAVSLIAALADFASRRRCEMIEAGQIPKRPSQRRARRRKNSS